MVAPMLDFRDDHLFSRWSRSRAKKDASMATWKKSILSKPTASLGNIRILRRPSVTMRMIETNHDGAPTAPCSMRSKLNQIVGVQKAVRSMLRGPMEIPDKNEKRYKKTTPSHESTCRELRPRKGVEIFGIFVAESSSRR